MKRLIVAIALAVAVVPFSACSTVDLATKPVDRVALQKAAYAARATYVGYLEVAVQITDMPRCERAPPPCVRQSVVDAIRSAQRTAGASTKSAEDAVKDMTSDPSVLAITVDAATRAADVFKSTVEANKKGG